MDQRTFAIGRVCLGLTALLVCLCPLRVGAQDDGLADALTDPGAAGREAADDRAPSALPGVPGDYADAVDPESAADSRRRGLLGSWIERRGRDEQLGLDISTGLFLGLGGAAVAAGVWVAADESIGLSGGLRLALPAISLLVGGFFISQGIVQLLEGSVGTRRWRRWREGLEAGELGPEEVARFEGELRTEAESARIGRMYTLAMGVGIAGAGAFIVGLTAALEGLSDLDQVLGYTYGGLYGALGVALLITSLLDTPAEETWQRYQRGEAPPGAELEDFVQVRPLIGPGLLGVQGTF